MNTPQVIVALACALVALAAFIGYRWRQRTRVAGIKDWIKDFLTARNGVAPDALNINCSDDQNWPVLVSYEAPGMRHDLQFSCPGGRATLALISEHSKQF